MSSMQPECENLSDIFELQESYSLDNRECHGYNTHHYQTSKAHHSKTVFSTQYCLILGIISKANA